MRSGMGWVHSNCAPEEAALLAAVQLELALGAFSVGIEAGGKDRAAIGAARAGYGADHARSARAELIGAGTSLRGLAVMRPFFFFIFLGIAVPAVTVLSIHKRLRPSVLTDCNEKSLNLRGDSHTTVACKEPDCYTRPLALSSPEFKESGMPTLSRRWDIYVFSPLGVRSQARLRRTL